MPTRWLVRCAGPHPSEVSLAHLHAAFSTWLDQSDEEHTSAVKPYSISAPRSEGRALVVEVGALTEAAALRLVEHARTGASLRLGHQHARVLEPPVLVGRAEWTDLEQHTEDRAWTLRFETPTTFRQGRRAVPWPAPAAVIRGLGMKWERFSDRPLRSRGPGVLDRLWVSDLEGSSCAVRIGSAMFSGYVGRVRYQCDDAEAAAAVGPLFALAPYSGVGSATTKGLGVTRLEPTWQPRSRPMVGV